MKNTFGNALTVTLFGESHGEAIGAVLDGISSGIRIDYEYINNKLEQRRPFGNISTARVEKDQYKIISGVFNGYTTGSPLCVVIPNENVNSKAYADFREVPRPSHADYTANVKYRGFQDYRGGGHFSGRVTVALVCVGAILECALEKIGVYIGSHISYLKGISDKPLQGVEDIKTINQAKFPVLDEQAKEKMLQIIQDASSKGDSVGGVLETCVHGLPAGVGEPWFDSLESMLSHALFSIPAVKGVEFGKGFCFADLYGSQANDAFYTDSEKVYTSTNNNGGINGGISNGMPLVFRSVIKPTPSIFMEQDSVNLNSLKNQKISIKGRHDPAIIHRGRAVVDAMTAITLADALTVKYGTDFLGNQNN